MVVTTTADLRDTNHNLTQQLVSHLLFGMPPLQHRRPSSHIERRGCWKTSLSDMWWLHRRQIYAIFPSKSQSHTTIGEPFIVRNVFFSTQKSNCDERMLEDIKTSFFYLHPRQLESYKVGVTFFFLFECLLFNTTGHQDQRL